ncbi:MAG: carboxymuconolactone decarboxylase family protein, partial [Casimicrobiaceae bacterium]
MRLPDWTPELKAQPEDLVQAVLQRRGGTLLTLDHALLWSEPLTRGWNVFLKAVRTEMSGSKKLRELAICTVALLTGADFEYQAHSRELLSSGGTQAELDALKAALADNPRAPAASNMLGDIEKIVIQYAAQMTLDVKVQDKVFAALKEHMDTTQIVELTGAIATYNMVARFLVALEIT